MKRSVPHRTDTLLGSYLFEPTCLFVETLLGLFILHVFPFLKITNIFLTSLHIISFYAIILQVEFVGVLRSVPLRRNEIRSILGDDCPLSSVQVKGQIRLKDTTLSLGSGQHSHLFVFCTTASGLFVFFSVSGF